MVWVLSAIKARASSPFCEAGKTQQDNASIHASRETKHFLQEMQVHTMPHKLPTSTPSTRLSTKMHIRFVALLVAAAILSSFDNVSAATVGQKITPMTATSVDVAQRIEAAQADSKRFLRRYPRHDDKDASGEERSAELAEKLTGLLPTIRTVSKLTPGNAGLTLQQLRVPFEQRLIIMKLLEMTPTERKAVLLLIK
ncbi:hypothetical protein PC120_g23134 [Phytophthora cactorum]|nr:hypothetical protein PC120_g23134 [Phytophthora cactorum]